MAEMASPTSASPAKKKKNLPFKRTIARRKSPDPFSDDRSPAKAASKAKDGEDDDDDGISMFRRSNEVFPLAIEEQQRRLKREEKRRKAVPTERESPQKQDAKRRRVSGDLDSDDDGFSASGSRRRSQRNSTPRSTSEYVQAKIVSPIPGFRDIKKGVGDNPTEIMRHAVSQSPRVLKSREASHPIIDIDDDDNIGVSATPNRMSWNKAIETTEPALTKEDDDDPLSDKSTPTQGEPNVEFNEENDIAAADDPPDEFSKYVLQAREREARANSVQAPTSEAGDNTGKGQQSSKSSNPATRPTHPSIKIMVSSLLPNTAAMLAKLKLTQTLSVIRNAWINYQRHKATAMPEDVERQIFLTWKGNRIYNTVTCASLGLELDSMGKVRWDPYSEDESGYHSGGLHFQAWTEELYAQYVKEKERERLRCLGELDEDEISSADGGLVDEQEEETEKLIRVILKAKDYKPLNTKVHMDTTVETMLTVFRELRKIPPDKETALYFDGEKLDEATTVQEADIEDMDNLEVHIKEGLSVVADG